MVDAQEKVKIEKESCITAQSTVIFDDGHHHDRHGSC
jgi:hypothetical protein